MEVRYWWPLSSGGSIIPNLRTLLWPIYIEGWILYMGSTLENSSPIGPGCDAYTSATWALQFGRIYGIKGVGEQRCCIEFVANTSGGGGGGKGGNHNINPLSSETRPYHFQWRIIYFFNVLLVLPGHGASRDYLIYMFL